MEIEGLNGVSMPQPTSGVASTETVQMVTGTDAPLPGEQKQPEFGMGKKEPAKSTLDSAVSGMNKSMTSTRCEYSYNEKTRRVSIKVFDKESDELIREVPPEKSQEMLERMWELTGLLVDEKR